MPRSPSKRSILDSPDPWPKFYGLQVLLSAYGHLGRSAEIAATKENLRTVLRERDEGEPDWLLTQQYFVFKHEADIERLLAGLGKAGVPELPADVDLRAKDRLTGAEIKSLIFGRELRGRRDRARGGGLQTVHVGGRVDQRDHRFSVQHRQELGSRRLSVQRVSEGSDHLRRGVSQSVRNVRPER